MPGLPSLLAALGIVGVVFALLSFLVMFFSGMPLQSDLGWVGGNLVLGLVLLVSAAGMNLDALRERMSTGEARRAGKYGTSAVLSTVLGIARLERGWGPHALGPVAQGAGRSRERCLGDGARQHGRSGSRA
jgi:hypothetical protein